jgi:hypothetical protein
VGNLEKCLEREEEKIKRGQCGVRRRTRLFITTLRLGIAGFGGRLGSIEPPNTEATRIALMFFSSCTVLTRIWTPSSSMFSKLNETAFSFQCRKKRVSFIPNVIKHEYTC